MFASFILNDESNSNQMVDSSNEHVINRLYIVSTVFRQTNSRINV